MKKDLPVLGWREWVGLPDLRIARIKAKVDTGARTSALHAVDVCIITRDGIRIVLFRVHPLQRSTRKVIAAEAPLAGHRRVRSSDGRMQLRPVIRTRMALSGEVRPIELTLASRDLMGFRLLLGRQAVRKRYLVDPGRSYLSGKRKKGKKG